MKNIFIVGCNGLLGQKLVSLLSDGFNNIYGLDIHPVSFLPEKYKFEYFQGDITRKESFKPILTQTEPEVIINAAAMTNVDACERDPESCRRINFEAVEHMAESALKVGAKLVHISTDYVFDGEDGPYAEDAPTNPLSVYGKSKLDSEKILLDTDIESAILRTVVLFGQGYNLKTDFINWLIEQLRAGNRCRIVKDQISNVTIVDDLAMAVKQVIELNKYDLYHVGGRRVLSRLDFALEIAEMYNLDQSLIEPILTIELNQPAKRPLKSGFIVDKAERDLQIRFLTPQESLEELIRQQKLNS